MSNEENTEKTLVEELTQMLEEGITEVADQTISQEEVTEELPEEEVEEETVAPEAAEEETVAPEAAEEENVAPEAAEEETVAPEEVEEETVAPEATEEETDVAEAAEEEVVTPEATEGETIEKDSSDEAAPVEEPQKKPIRKINKKLAAIVAAAILAVLLIGYFATSFYYSDRFLIKTAVNGTDCSGKTIEEVEELIQKQVEEYALTIHTSGGASEQIKGTDIGIKYIGYNQLKEAFAEQNSYLWPGALFKANNIEAEIIFDYDQDKLNAMIAGLDCMKEENQAAPVSATVVYKDGAFVIQSEVAGTQIDVEKLTEVINSSIMAINTEIDLRKSGCYVQPRFSKNSSEVSAARDEMNQYLNAEINYSLGSIETSLDKNTFASWISVDENMAPVVSVGAAKEFAKNLSAKYNTADQAGVITTPTGKQAPVAVASYGRAVGIDAEGEQITQDIKSGKKVTRAPIFSRQATPEGQFAWGNTYLEVDITEQHMWYIVNGQIALETDVVTGWKNRMDTPIGLYSILEMVPGKYLRGDIVNGKPSYVTWVNRWMRVTWSGIGFHDAGWQSAFGGERYATGYGSHGCINMPPAKASELYSMLQVGCPVVIHN